MSKKTKEESYSIRLTQVTPNEWVAELFKNDKIVKTYEKTMYNGAIALATQYLLRAPYVELAE